MPSIASRTFAWTGALLFAGSLTYFLYTYIVTFGETTSGAAAPPTSTWRAVAWNTALFGAFATHHSLFARTRLRSWVATHVPPRLERSLYVWVASLLLIAVCVLWAPLAGVAWSMTGPWRWVIRFPLLVGIWLTLRSAGVIDVWDLAGVRQLGTPRRGTEEHAFKTEGPYGLVRHPIYLGWVLVVFSLPTMTMTQLVFAAVSCLYLVIAIPLEERTLVATAGAAYERYIQRVRWRLVPGIY